jgi:hypothetical protein
MLPKASKISFSWSASLTNKRADFAAAKQQQDLSSLFFAYDLTYSYLVRFKLSTTIS